MRTWHGGMLSITVKMDKKLMMSENKQHSDTWLDSDELKHQLISESRHRHMAGNILFSRCVSLP
jgi:hypothetical protein